MVKEFGFEKVGRQFGITGTAVQKWCKDYQIPHKKKELIAWYNSQVGIINIEKKHTSIQDRMKPVKQIDIQTGQIINIFPSLRSAAVAIGYKNVSHIIDVCKGKKKTAYNYVWEYA